MKALSLLQPWAAAVVYGLKDNETRSWQTKFRGELLIHASAKRVTILGELGKYIYNCKGFYLHYGAIIGKVTLVDVLPTTSLYNKETGKQHITDQELAFGDYSPGRFAWIFENPIIFAKPIPTKGALSIWTFNEITY